MPPVVQQVVQGQVVYPPPGQVVQGTVVQAQPVIVGAWDPSPHGVERPRQHHMGAAAPMQQTMSGNQSYLLFQSAAPPGLPPGCVPVHEAYCGPLTVVLGLFICVCFGCGCFVVCCPCDERTVYVAPDGRRYLSNGLPVTGL
mmetsp:Transcript_47843/g.113685  ORF Transcript_47843/g.113685 Transcript_47843/m.113685 type:complete len:142 (+) Transcript_47843:187-612(+)|eukprot:CAMPEP_0178419872 /NCGR_PEP_ID=MMETSP0689_2-20121128/25835_1 /TAXON_ID=160604 /ORGANISM="Amphidinium massartii, Strain CS-259" /LENGTH=141 /DNA_ID=CAMNT_0020041325 /DNA_START=93 /DNA_END=518 /DNA_ORIENTATION=+